MISSLVLNPYWLFRYFPDLKTQYPATEKFFKTLFAIAFFICRATWWFVVSIPWLIKSTPLLWDEKDTAGTAAVFSFVFGNVVLCYLQIMWTIPIWTGFKESFFPRI